jgi:mannosyl-oligosaccharide alpha-1,2-mannosidase
VDSLISLPTARPEPIPRIQHQRTSEDGEAKAIRLQRLATVKEAFQHAWNGYKQNAWMADEVGPLSGERHNFFGGWAASLVDALDTLWIMDMKEEFAEAVKAIEQIDFTSTEEAVLNIFETTIRYMGGFLGAYDLSGGEYPILLTKAKELGEMLLVAFDTPNRMPVTRWHWMKARNGEKQEAGTNALAAEIGSLTLEFTRLSQITGDGRYFDAVQRIMDQFDQQQMQTKLPGMWPVVVNAKDLDLRNDTDYTLGAMADSLYEYLPKVSSCFSNVLIYH